MRKTILLLSLTAFACVAMTACHKNCVCKYYHNDKLYDIRTWDDKHVTDEDCEGMNDSYTLNIPLDQIGNIPLGEPELVDVEVVCERD